MSKLGQCVEQTGKGSSPAVFGWVIHKKVRDGHWWCCMWLLVSVWLFHCNRAWLHYTTTDFNMSVRIIIVQVCVCPHPWHTHTQGYWSEYEALNQLVCVCHYRFLPTRLRRSLYGQSLHHTHSHSDVWSFCVFLCVAERCVYACVCQSATFLQCLAPFDFCSLPLSSCPSFSFVIFRILPLCLASLHPLSFSPLVFFPSLPISPHHFLPHVIVSRFSSLVLPPLLNHSLAFFVLLLSPPISFPPLSSPSLV